MPDALPADEYVATKVIRSWDETPHFHALSVELGALGASHRAPGQVVKLRARDVGEGYFALANAPSPGGSAELLLKRGGAVADAVIGRRAPGVEVTAPFGRGFPVE